MSAVEEYRESSECIYPGARPADKADHYGYRIEVWEHDVEGRPCDVTEPGEDDKALAEAHKRLSEGASSVVIQLVTTWRQL